MRFRRVCAVVALVLDGELELGAFYAAIALGRRGRFRSADDGGAAGLCDRAAFLAHRAPLPRRCRVSGESRRTRCPITPRSLVSASATRAIGAVRRCSALRPGWRPGWWRSTARRCPRPTRFANRGTRSPARAGARRGRPGRGRSLGEARGDDAPVNHDERRADVPRSGRGRCKLEEELAVEVARPPRGVLGARRALRRPSAGAAAQALQATPSSPPGRWLTDPDSRNLKSARLVQGYNVQAAVDENQIVLAAEVTVDSADFGHLDAMVDAVVSSIRRGARRRPWHQEQMENIVGRDPVLIDAATPPNAFMRRVLEHGGSSTENARRWSSRSSRVQPPPRPLLRRGRAACRSDPNRRGSRPRPTAPIPASSPGAIPRKH